MKNIQAIKVLLIVAFVSCCALLRCAHPNSGGTETGDAKIVAMLYNPDGSPAASAKVCFYRHGDDPRNSHAVDSTTTDNNGNYSKNLDTGTYNILASLGSNATFQDSVVVIEHDTTRPPPDTLRSLGSISGKIELHGTDDPRTVFVLFMGSNTFTRPTDMLGNFTATNMAKGKYPVTLITTLDDYAVMDTSFVITAGRDSVIPQPIVMEYTGIPIPKGLRIEYDTMMQIVTLYWNTPTTGRPVQSYTVYRKHSDSASFESIKAGVTDTAYSDSTGIQDQTYEYRVAVVDTSTTEGVRSTGVNTTVVGMFVLKGIIGDSGSGLGQFQGPSDVAVSSDGKIFITDYFGNKVLVFDTLGTFIKEDTGFQRPIGIELRDDNTYFVLEEQSTAIRLIDSSGSEVFSITSGIWFQEIAWDMAISPWGDLFIVDRENDRVRVYDSTGTFKKDLLFSFQPRSVKFLNASEMVLGFSNVAGNTAIIDTAGTIIRQFTNGPSRRLAITRNGNIIGGWDHRSVRIVTPDGVVVGTYVYNTTDDNGGICTDGLGNIYISMLDSKKVIVLFRNDI